MERISSHLQQIISLFRPTLTFIPVEDYIKEMCYVCCAGCSTFEKGPFAICEQRMASAACYGAHHENIPT